jgi:hypothetical protein
MTVLTCAREFTLRLTQPVSIVVFALCFELFEPLVEYSCGRVVDALRVEVETETPALTPHLSRRVS